MTKNKKGRGKDLQAAEMHHDGKDIPKELVKALRNVPPQQREKVEEAFLQVTSTYFQGPIPDPQTLQAYNDILDGGAERIFVQFEEQSRHRRELETSVIKAQSKESSRGQLFAFIIAISCIGIAFYSSLIGNQPFAIVLGGTTICTVVGAFLYGKRSQRKDLREKR